MKGIRVMRFVGNRPEPEPQLYEGDSLWFGMPVLPGMPVLAGEIEFVKMQNDLNNAIRDMIALELAPGTKT